MANQSVTDLEELATQYVQRQYAESLKHMKEKIPFEKLTVTVDTSKLLITTETPEYQSTSGSLDNSSKPHVHVLFRTTFCNSTDHEQSYTLNTERSTRQVASFTASKGFTVGIDCGVNLTLPFDVLQANASFKREMRLDKSMQAQSEEQVVWRVESQVRVPARTRTVVELVVSELEYRAKYKTVSYFSGKILALLSQRDGSEVLRVPIYNLKQAFQECDGFRVDPISKQLQFVTEGSCYFKYGAEQSVRTSEEPL